MSSSSPPSELLATGPEEGKQVLHRHDYKKATKILTRAIRLYSEEIDCPDDLAVVYSARSPAAYFYSERFNLALLDAEVTVEKRPSWSKGYFRKAEALAELGKRSDALESYRTARSLVETRLINYT